MQYQPVSDYLYGYLLLPFQFYVSHHYIISILFSGPGHHQGIGQGHLGEEVSHAQDQAVLEGSARDLRHQDMDDHHDDHTPQDDLGLQGNLGQGHDSGHIQGHLGEDFQDHHHDPEYGGHGLGEDHHSGEDLLVPDIGHL